MKSKGQEIETSNNINNEDAKSNGMVKIGKNINSPIDINENNDITLNKKSRPISYKIPDLNKETNKNGNSLVIPQKENKENITIINDTINLGMKNKNYNKQVSSVIQTGKDKIIDIYQKKTDELLNIYFFSEKYLSFTIQIFKKICEPFYSKLSSTYINNIKPYFKYFKDLIPVLNTFSDKITLLDSSIVTSIDIDELMRTEQKLNSYVKNLNVLFANTCSNLAKNLKEIIDKPIFGKYETIETKFDENFGKMINLISNLEHYKVNYINNFKKKYAVLFLYKNKVNELDKNLLKTEDYLLMEYYIVQDGNKAIKKIEIFLKNIQIFFEDSSKIFGDYLEILKQMIKIYYQENKKIILPKIFSEKSSTNLENLLTQDIRKNIEKKFRLKNIINYCQDEKLKNEVNHLLLNLQDTLSQSQLVSNDIIDNISNFNLNKFKSTKSFFEFLQFLIPPKIKLNYDDLIQFKTKLKRDCGLFKGWKKCHLVISYQGHILFFDEEILKNAGQLGNNIYFDKENFYATDRNLGINNNQTEILKGTKFDTKEIKNEEVEINDELSYGIIPQKLVGIYYKSNYGIKKIAKKGQKYLFEIWEKDKDIEEKKNKILVFDALDKVNLDNIFVELTDNNFYDE